MSWPTGSAGWDHRSPHDSNFLINVKFLINISFFKARSDCFLVLKHACSLEIQCIYDKHVSIILATDSLFWPQASLFWWSLQASAKCFIDLYIYLFPESIIVLSTTTQLTLINCYRISLHNTATAKACTMQRSL